MYFLTRRSVYTFLAVIVLFVHGSPVASVAAEENVAPESRVDCLGTFKPTTYTKKDENTCVGETPYVLNEPLCPKFIDACEAKSFEFSSTLTHGLWVDQVPVMNASQTTISIGFVDNEVPMLERWIKVQVDPFQSTRRLLKLQTITRCTNIRSQAEFTDFQSNHEDQQSALYTLLDRFLDLYTQYCPPNAT